MPRPHDNNNKKSNGKINQKSIRQWHRWVGYASLFFVLILSITGLILNRTEKLGLNQIMVQNEFVSTLYGLSPNSPPIHFKVKDRWMSWLEGRVYLDGALIAQNTDRLIGGALVDDMIILGTENSLSLYLKDGSLVETLDSGSLPGQITAIGQSGTDRILVGTVNGNYSSDGDFVNWEKLPLTTPLSSDHTAQPPEQIVEKIIQDFQGQGVTLSRLILDLHSGHIMGSFGPYLMDLAALSLIFLGFTGLMKRKRNDKDKRRRK